MILLNLLVKSFQMASRSNIHGGHKAYSLRRMRLAIDRAIHGKTAQEKEKAARWAAAWGLSGGIPPVSGHLNNRAAASLPGQPSTSRRPETKTSDDGFTEAT